MAIVDAISNFQQHLAGGIFTLITDSLALTWLFCSRDLSPKLHR